MHRTTRLFTLQEIDSALDGHKRRLAEIAAAIGESPAVRAAQSALTTCEDQIASLSRQVRQLAADTQAVRDKRKRSSERLYSGAVSNPKELQDLQAEIESLDRHASELDDRQLELMVELEGLEEEAETLRARLEDLQDAWMGGQTDLLDEKRGHDAAVAGLAARRGPAAAAVDTADLATYDRLRASKHGKAVASMSKAGTCGMCGVTVSTALRQQVQAGTQLHTCPTCGRLLHPE